MRGTDCFLSVVVALVWIVGIVFMLEAGLRQQSIEMQESRPYAVIGE